MNVSVTVNLPEGSRVVVAEGPEGRTGVHEVELLYTAVDNAALGPLIQSIQRTFPRATSMVLTLGFPGASS